jgi:VIT1/CCC1 family predicted Fe2+/Mn2+ transporter
MKERTIENARKAFENNDLTTSKGIHEIELIKTSIHQKEPHQGGSGEYVQSIVFGGLDGIITTFAIIVAAAASGLNYGMILIVGFSNLLGDAIGMAVGDYLSSKAEDDHEKAERKREEWEIENVPEAEKSEMIDVYTAKGIPKDDAIKIVELLFKSKPAFLDVMMIEELDIMPNESSTVAWKGAVITFGSFFVFGGIPMLPYLFSGNYHHIGKLDGVFAAAVVLFAVALYTLGALKGKITGKKWWLTGLTMLLNGSVTTLIAYFIGVGLEKSVGN